MSNLRSSLPPNWHRDPMFVQQIFDRIDHYLGNGWNDSQIAREVGCTPRTIQRYRTSGIRPDQHQNQAGNISDAEIANALREGRSQYSLRREYGVSMRRSARVRDSMEW